MPHVGTTELLILLAVLVLLFGAKKLPETARGLGRSIRILKAETDPLRGDDLRDKSSAAPPPTTRENNELDAGKEAIR